MSNPIKEALQTGRPTRSADMWPCYVSPTWKQDLGQADTIAMVEHMELRAVIGTSFSYPAGYAPSKQQAMQHAIDQLMAFCYSDFRHELHQLRSAIFSRNSDEALARVARLMEMTT